MAAAPRAGTVGKGGKAKGPKVAKPVAPAAKPAAAKQRARIDGDAFAARMKRARGTSLRRGINESDRENALSGAQRRATAPAKRFAASNQRQARADRTAAAAKAFYGNYGSPSTFARRQRQSTANSPSFGSKRRGTARPKPIATTKPAGVSPKTNGQVAELTRFRDSQRKQLKEIKQKIKEAGPRAGGLRLEKLKIQDRLNQLNKDLVRSNATTAVRRTKKS
jgi:hypothetical protein